MRTDWFDLLVVQGSSPAPQFESISSSVLSLLYGPTLTSVNDYWKKHSFDSMDLFQQIDVSVFYVFIYFSFKRLYVLLGIADFFSFIFISWRIITLQYCSGFCHTLT